MTASLYYKDERTFSTRLVDEPWNEMFSSLPLVSIFRGFGERRVQMAQCKSPGLSVYRVLR